MQITYQKRDGSILKRYRNTVLPYNIGDETSMGWKVLNIEYEYNNKYYSKHEYNSILSRNRNKLIKRRITKETYTKEFKTLLYYIVALSIINIIKAIFDI